MLGQRGTERLLGNQAALNETFAEFFRQGPSRPIPEEENTMILRVAAGEGNPLRSLNVKFRATVSVHRTPANFLADLANLPFPLPNPPNPCQYLRRFLSQPAITGCPQIAGRPVLACFSGELARWAK